MRHAHAGDRDDWDGPDRLRPLTEKGWRQARALVGTLSTRPVERILSSPYVRCTQTVEPLAAVRGIPLEPDEDLAEGRGADALGLVHRLAGASVVLCTHGDIVLDVLEGLAASGLAVADDPALGKGSTWVLDWVEGRCVRGLYVPPPRSG